MEATEQRKNENEEYKDLMASDSAAKELLEFAKNRLNKFYNPKLYKAAPKTERSAEDRIFVAEGGTLPTAPAGGIAGTGISAAQVAPPPPETFGPYQTKSAENSGVIDMINILITDLEKDLTEAETTEKDAQADYASMMRDSAEQRTSDSKTLADKAASKAALEGELQAHKAERKSLGKELAATLKYIATLHADCDWLLKYFDMRREARASEINALGNARAVLSGADYSLLSVRSSRLSVPCPSTTVSVTGSEDAAGTPQWFGPFDLPNPGACTPIGVKGIKSVKLCGPGKFTLSRMSCDRHDYKAWEIEQPGTHFTEGDCKEYPAAGTVLEGYMGSGTFGCSATQR